MTEANQNKFKQLKIPVTIQMDNIELEIDDLKEISQEDIIRLFCNSNSSPLFSLKTKNGTLATGEIIQDENQNIYFQVKGLPQG